MSNVRDLGRKIHSLKNMQKVTRAMNMISSIKLRKYLTVQESADKFLAETENIRQQVLYNLRGSNHPSVKGYAEQKKAHIVLFTADKGLCGTHNSSVLKAVDSFVRKLAKKDIAAEFTCLGIKAGNHAKRESWEVIRQEEMHERTMTSAALKEISDDIYSRFLDGTVQQVWVFGKIFRSTLQQDTEQRMLMPFSAEQAQEKGGSGGKEHEEGTSAEGLTMQTEPGDDQLAETYGRIYLNDILRGMLLHSYLSEHSSRLTAMENATRNSEDLIGKYVTLQNHARQAAITNELIEIVSGKEALKG